MTAVVAGHGWDDKVTLWVKVQLIRLWNVTEMPCMLVHANYSGRPQQHCCHGTCGMTCVSLACALRSQIQTVLLLRNVIPCLSPLHRHMLKYTVHRHMLKYTVQTHAKSHTTQTHAYTCSHAKKTVPQNKQHSPQQSPVHMLRLTIVVACVSNVIIKHRRWMILNC